jgi:UDP-glucuronate decarboxylase
MKSLLLTGGTGFFGRAILRYLISVKRTNGSMPFGQVTVMSRSPENFHLRYPGLTEMSWLNWHKGNVLDLATFPQNSNFDFILHAASDSTNNAAPTPLQTFQQIVDGTQNLLSFATQCGAKRFLLTSSGGAYGPQPSQIESIPETYMGMPDSLNPANTYGVAKRQAEHLCALYGHQHGIETVVARCFAFVGEDLPRDAHFAIGNFIRDALERPEIVVNGNGSPIRSYMHQSDLAHWLMALLQHGATGNAYNVGSDEAISIANLAYLVRDILAPNKKVVIKDAPLGDNASRNRYVPDITKAKTELGLKVTVPLSKAIQLSAPQIAT